MHKVEVLLTFTASGIPTNNHGPSLIIKPTSRPIVRPCIAGQREWETQIRPGQGGVDGERGETRDWLNRQHERSTLAGMSRVERTLAEKEFNMHQFILRACAINLTIMHQFKPEKELRTNTCANEHHVHGYSKKFFVSKIVTSPGGTQHRRPINLESRCNLDNGEIHHLHHEWRIRLPVPTSSASWSYPCRLPPPLLYLAAIEILYLAAIEIVWTLFFNSATEIILKCQ